MSIKSSQRNGLGVKSRIGVETTKSALLVGHLMNYAYERDNGVFFLDLLMTV